MSQENVEILRRAHEALNRGDLDGYVADFAPEFEYFTSGVITDAGRVYRGPDEFKRFVKELFFDEFREVRSEITEAIDTEDQVVYTLTMHARGKQSGAETSWSFCQVVTLRDGRVTRAQGFVSRDEALEAVGLSE